MKIGVIGIGLMGLPIAQRLCELGHEVQVCDIDPSRLALAHGCVIAPRAAALAARCELVIVAVVDAEQTHEVLFGPRGVMQAQPMPSAVMLCPTIGAADTERFAAALSAQGIAVIDAPMSGGPLRARAGTMSLMVACADEVFASWQPLLAQLSSQVHRVGTCAGDGARTKLVNNLLAAINLAGMAEAMALAQRLGLDPGVTLAVIEQSSGQSWIGSERIRRVLARDTTPSATMSLLAKDSALALAEARAATLATPTGDAAAAQFAAAVAAGWGQADDSTLWPFVAQRGAAAIPAPALAENAP